MQALTTAPALAATVAQNKKNHARDKFTPQNSYAYSYYQQIFLERLKSLFNKSTCT
ncbi:hypothetical protein [Enterobacter roggenkampii]|jgi:hypothetical protein|uniref:hypothetical protein n=1 Tax=Enterobacter roggenkampii TaxID=1812935 RepID=UPI0018F6ECFF|nr:hypothetical protein [Enterobacter roggenkampii]